jgi:hypothetical protein
MIKHLFYADDLKIFHEISSKSDADFLQENLNKLNIWCDDNQLHLNVRCSWGSGKIGLVGNFVFTVLYKVLSFFDFRKMFHVHKGSKSEINNFHKVFNSILFYFISKPLIFCSFSSCFFFIH